MRRDVTIYWDAFDGYSHFQGCKTYEICGTGMELADAAYLKEEVRLTLLHEQDQSEFLETKRDPGELASSGDWAIEIDELGPVMESE